MMHKGKLGLCIFLGAIPFSRLTHLDALCFLFKVSFIPCKKRSYFINAQTI